MPLIKSYRSLQTQSGILVLLHGYFPIRDLRNFLAFRGNFYLRWGKQKQEVAWFYWELMLVAAGI